MTRANGETSRYYESRSYGDGTALAHGMRPGWRPSSAGLAAAEGPKPHGNRAGPGPWAEGRGARGTCAERDKNDEPDLDKKMGEALREAG